MNLILIKSFSTFKFFDSESSSISQKQLSKSWYWGFADQKLIGTPEDWIYKEAERSSCWHKIEVDCF